MLFYVLAILFVVFCIWFVIATFAYCKSFFGGLIVIGTSFVIPPLAVVLSLYYLNCKGD